jgi:hypothetical protein
MSNNDSWIPGRSISVGSPSSQTRTCCLRLLSGRAANPTIRRPVRSAPTALLSVDLSGSASRSTAQVVGGSGGPDSAAARIVGLPALGPPVRRPMPRPGRAREGAGGSFGAGSVRRLAWSQPPWLGVEHLLGLVGLRCPSGACAGSMAGSAGEALPGWAGHGCRPGGVDSDLQGPRPRLVWMRQINP